MQYHHSLLCAYVYVTFTLQFGSRECHQFLSHSSWLHCMIECQLFSRSIPLVWEKHPRVSINYSSSHVSMDLWNNLLPHLSTVVCCSHLPHSAIVIELQTTLNNISGVGMPVCLGRWGGGEVFCPVHNSLDRLHDYKQCTTLKMVKVPPPPPHLILQLLFFVS